MSSQSQWFDFYFHVDNHPSRQTGVWRTWVDIFLLDALVRKAIADTNSIWIIHRRFRADHAGHEFKFSAYTTLAERDVIENAIRAHPAFQNFIDRISQFNDASKRFYSRSADMELHSRGEGHWPQELAGPWLDFMRTSSKMLLDLTGNIIAVRMQSKRPPQWDDVDMLESYYTEIDREVASIWHRLGWPAYLHHLNMVFGYEPVAIPPGVGTGLLRF
jgi:hypothetical protein